MSKARIEKLASFRRREALKDKRRLESLFAYAGTSDRAAVADRGQQARIELAKAREVFLGSDAWRY